MLEKKISSKACCDGCAGYLSNPPGVLGVEATTLELGPLSGSNLLAIDRTQWKTSNTRMALLAHQSNWTIPSTVFRMISLWLSLDWGSVSSDKLRECNYDEGRPISVRLWSCLIVMGNFFHCISQEYSDGFPGEAEHYCSSLRIPSLNVQFVFGSLRAYDPGNLASDSCGGRKRTSVLESVLRHRMSDTITVLNSY